MEEKNCCAAGWRSPKTILIFLGVVLLAAIIIFSILREKIVQNDNWTINVVGQGKVAYQPEVAKVSLGVQIDKVQKADDALNQLNTKMNSIVKALKEAGISEEDVQTQNYTLSPQYDTIQGELKVGGYSTNQTVVVKVKDIVNNQDKVSKIIAIATKAGANQLGGVAFEPENVNDLKQEARVKAITDARNKATGIAGALGVKLGKVVGWWENTISSPDYSGYSYYGGGIGGGGGGMAGGSVPSVPTGLREIIIEVNLNYKIK
ncbi:MAG: SIMPL domain-containing protein [Patescibacteria group bacterium]|nr:SIMPL domain-containing protein [Patescibacteria group bacterium]MDD4611054.1 SIMPL domain-containing protein [Patescibacteria group bacterium]